MNAAAFIYEIGALKRIPRAGWLSVGVCSPESVAEHSFRTAVIGFIIASMEGADVDKVVKMCLLHDIHEARLGDLTHAASKYVKADAERALKDMLKGLDGTEMVRVAEEYMEGVSKEALLAKDADLLEMLAQAIEYRSAGNRNLDGWIEDTVRRIRSDAGKSVARQLLSTSPVDFLKD